MDRICPECERPIRKDGRSVRHPSCQKRHARRLAHDRHVFDTYGLTGDQYRAILAAQGGKCAICKGGSTKSLAVDHDHRKTGLASIRGLCCSRCNSQLLARGARDDIEILRSAVRYLENPPAQGVLNDEA